MVLFIVLKQAKFRPDMVCQHLDDCCAAAPYLSQDLERYDSTFSKVASLLGVKLAPRDDPEKSFGPAQSGVILGDHYDTICWTWALPQEKLFRLLHLLKQLYGSDEAEQHLFWTLVGKIQHIKALIPCGKFNVDHLIRANSVSLERNFMVPVTPDIRRQLWFWLTMLRLCSGRCPIPDPDKGLPPCAIDVYTNAAGGAPAGLQGAWAVSASWWAFVPWSDKINKSGRSSTGRALGRMMSALELVGPLLVLCSGFAWCRNNPIKIWVDNAGSVFIWKKGYSTSCLLSSTLVKALAAVAAGLGCRVDLVKITLCSTPLADMADDLSKCAFARFWALAAQHNFVDLPVGRSWVPVSLTSWLHNPGPR